MTFLYHGSTTKGIKVLEPRKRYTPAGKIEYAAIYASSLPAYAVAHAFPWSSDEGFDVDVKNEKVYLYVPIAEKQRLHVPISIYKLSAQNFQHTKEEITGYTWHTAQPAQVIEEVQYENVEEAIKKLGGEIIIT